MPASEITFRVEPREMVIIDRIVDRAETLAREHHDPTFNKLSCRMDLCATHANGNPLRLGALADADDFNFIHDVWGIRRHLNRETGKLEGLFSPRFSQPAGRA